MLSHFSHVQLFAILWIIACQAPLSMGFSRQYWSGLPFPPPGDCPSSGVELESPALHADSLPLSHPGKPNCRAPLPNWTFCKFCTVAIR